MNIDIEILKIIKFEFATAKQLNPTATEVKEYLDLIITIESNSEEIRRRKKEYFELKEMGEHKKAKTVLDCIMAFKKDSERLQKIADEKIYSIYENPKWTFRF